MSGIGIRTLREQSGNSFKKSIFTMGVKEGRELGYIRYRTNRIIRRVRRKIDRSRKLKSVLTWLKIAETKKAVLFIGYVEAGLGLGESLRGLLSSVAQTNLPFAIYPYNVEVENRFIGQFMPERYDR